MGTGTPEPVFAWEAIVCSRYWEGDPCDEEPRRPPDGEIRFQTRTITFDDDSWNRCAWPINDATEVQMTDSNPTGGTEMAARFRELAKTHADKISGGLALALATTFLSGAADLWPIVMATAHTHLR